MDQVDRSFQEENARILAMIKLSSNYKDTHKHTGACLSCGEQVAAPKLFCDNVCAGEHNKQQSRRGVRH